MKTSTKVIIASSLAVLAFIGLVLVPLGYSFVKIANMVKEESVNQITLLPVIQEEIGISTGTPYVDGREVITLSARPQSIAEEAGIQQSDILVGMTLGEFGQLLYDHRGEEAVFEVKRDGELVEITLPVPVFERGNFKEEWNKKAPKSHQIK